MKQKKSYKCVLTLILDLRNFAHIANVDMLNILCLIWMSYFWFIRKLQYDVHVYAKMRFFYSFVLYHSQLTSVTSRCGAPCVVNKACCRWGRHHESWFTSVVQRRANSTSVRRKTTTGITKSIGNVLNGTNGHYNINLHLVISKYLRHFC